MHFAMDRKGVPSPPFAQLLRVMKLTTILLLAACLQLAAKGYSQKVTLDLRDASLEQVCKEIRKQTGFQFLYDDYLVNLAGRITVRVKEVTVEEALAKALASTGFTFKMVE